jgi:hypothetical protein
MGEDVQNKDALASGIDARNQPVAISVNIEDCPSTNNIGMSEITPDIS